MKLHLPKMLTAALFAAFISFTQASGTELSDAKLSLANFTQESLDAAASQAGGSWVFTNITGDESGVYTSESGKQGYFTSSVDWTTRVDSNRTIWSAIVTVDGESLLNTFGTGFGYVIQQNTGAPLGIGYTNGKATSSWQGGANGNPVNKALNQCLDGNGNITLGIIYKGNGGCTIYVVDGQENEYHIDNTGLKGGYTADYHPRIDLTPAAGIEYKSLYVFGGLVADDDMKAMMKGLVAPAVVSSYTWSATGDTAAWDITSTTTWAEAVAYKNSLTNTVTFGADAGLAKAVTVDGDIKAGTVAVNDSYTFTVASGHSLDVVELSLAAGKKLTLDGAGTTSISNLTNNGEIAINKDARLDLNTVTANNTDLGTITTGEGTLAIETVVISGGNGKITFENATDNGTVQLTGGKVVYGGETEHAVQNLRLSQTGQQVSTVDVEAGATLHIEGTLVGKDQPSRMNGSFSLSHWSAANVVNVYGTLISDVVVSSCDGTGTINVYEGGRLEMRDGLNRGNYNNNAITINVAGGATLATGTTYNTTETKNSDTMIVSLADGATLEAYYKGAATTANIAKAMTLGGVTVKTGDSGKTLTLSGALTANGTIAQDGEGSLVLAGAIDITGNTGELVKNYVGGQTNGNGFLESSGLITIYTGDNVSLDEAAVITYHGDNVTADVHEGKYTVSATMDYSAFYVRSGSELISTALTHPEVGSVVLSADTTINMDAATSMAVAVVEGADNTTIAATEDVTITSLTGLTDGKTLTISAAGHEVALQGDNTFRGNLVVDKGTLKLDTGDRKKVLGEFNGNHASGQAAPAPDKTITINEGGVLDLNGKSDLTYVYTLNGGSLVNTGKAIGTGSMQTVGIKLEKDSYVGGTYNFYLLGPGYDNTFVELNNHKLTKTGANTFGFKNTAISDGTIEVQEGNIEFLYADSDTNVSLAADIILNGGSVTGETVVVDDIEITAQKATTIDHLKLHIADDKTVTINAGEVLTFTHDITPVSGAVDVHGTVNVGGNIDLSSGGNSTATLTLKDDSVTTAAGMWMTSGASLLVEEGAVLTLGKLYIEGKTDGAISTTAENDNYGTGKANFTLANVDITATGDLTLGNKLVNSAVHTGEYTVSLDSTIAVDAENTLSLDGTFAIDSISGPQKSTYAGGDVQGNGFATTTTTRTVYTVEDGGNLDVDGAHFTVGGNEVDLDHGIATTTGTDNTTFWVFSETEKVSTAKKQAELEDINVFSGAKLVVDEDFNSANIHAMMDIAAVEVSENVTLHGTIENMELTGAGTYALTSGTKTLGTGVSLGDDWNGTVRLSGSVSDIKFDASVLGDHVEAYGLSGYFYDLTADGHGTYAGTLTLTNPGEDTPALLINNGYTRENAYYELAGTVDGNGIWRFDKADRAVTNRIIFSGDTADWDGALELVKGYTLELTFAQTDGEMGAAITRIGGTLNMIVGSEDGQSTMFNQEVTASDLTINAGATATFAADATFNSLSGAGSLVVGGGATLTVTGSVAEGVQIEAESGATIAGEGIDAAQVGIAAEGTATFADGIAQESGIVFSEGAVVTNNGEQAAAYNTDLDTMTVTAETLYHIGGADVEVANKVDVHEIVNVSGATLTLANAEATTALNSMTIGDDSTVVVYSDAQAAQEGTVTISESLTAGHGAVLAADLELLEGSSLDVSGTEGAGLTMGSNVGLNTGDLIAVMQGDESVTDIAVVDAYLRNYFAQGNEYYTLFTGVDDFTINGVLQPKDLVFTDWCHFDYEASSIFSNLIENTYALVYDMDGGIGAGHGTVALKLIPEPATGTLSLLALMALAARRRKH